LFPFSFSEYLKLQHIEPQNIGTQNEAVITGEFDNYLLVGGFPEVNKLGTAILSEIYGDVINNDIIIRHKIRHIGTFKEMAGYLFSNYGQIASFSKLKNVFQIKHLQTIKNYLDYLEETFLIFVLNKFSFKLKEQIIAPKKIYPIDAGLASHMTRSFSINRGALLETTVFLELARRKSYYFPQKEIYFWRNYNDCEVDFVVKEKNEIKTLIQVSESLREMNTKTRELRGIEKAAGELNCSNLLILTADETGEEKIGDLTIKICPAWKWVLNQS
jgi:predicted AAA+ superfamily ATPase